MTRSRCGARLPEETVKRIKHTTCRKFVAVEGARCNLHQAPLPEFDRLMRKVFD